MSSVAEPRFKLDAGTPGTLGVSGVLSFDTAAAALRAIQSALAVGSVVRLDLGEVRQSDSAGLACVLAVTAEADRRGQALQVVRIPDGMRVLAQVCEVESLIA